MCVYLWILLGLSYISLAISSCSKLFAEQVQQVEKKAMSKVKVSQLANMTLSNRVDMTSHGDDLGSRIFLKSDVIAQTVMLDDDNTVTLVKCDKF